MAYGVNNLADKAAEIFSDFEGEAQTLVNFKATAAKLKLVCHRLAAIESELRRGTPERSCAEADIGNKCQTYGRLRREKVKATATSRIEQLMNPNGHCLHFHKTKLCGNCIKAVHTRQELPDECPSCGIHIGTWRCTRCNLQTRGKLQKFYDTPCSQNDPMHLIPNLSGQEGIGIPDANLDYLGHFSLPEMSRTTTSYAQELRTGTTGHT